MDFSIKSHCAVEMAATQFSLALRQLFLLPSHLLISLGYFLILNIRLHICWCILEFLSLIGGVVLVSDMELELYFTEVVGSGLTSCTLGLVGAEDVEL